MTLPPNGLQVQPQFQRIAAGAAVLVAQGLAQRSQHGAGFVLIERADLERGQQPVVGQRGPPPTAASRPPGP